MLNFLKKTYVRVRDIEVGKKILYPLTCVVLLVLSLSRVEVYLNQEKQDIQIH